MKSKKGILINIGWILGLAILFGAYSQLYSPAQEILITDSYSITPKSQPFHFIAMWFATIAAILFALWLGKSIAFFLWTRGLLLSVVGAFMILGAGFLGYVSLVLRKNADSTGGLVVMGIMILFLGGLGATMLLSSIFGKKK